jgi:hypothetical protein
MADHFVGREPMTRKTRIVIRREQKGDCEEWGRAMRKHNRVRRDDGRQPRNAAQPIGDVLLELLALYSARFPQYKIVILSPAEQLGPGSIESTPLTHPA